MVTSHSGQPSASELQARIAEEQRRLAVEEEREQALTAARVEPLRSGNDAALDKIETQLDGCRTIQLRIKERLGLLASAVAQALTASESAGLDQIAAQAEASRAAGEKLLSTKYTKLAAALSRLLEEVHAHEAAITLANARLERAGREPVPQINAFRCRKGFHNRVGKRVLVRPGDSRHPDFSEMTVMGSRSGLYNRRTNRRGESVEIEITESGYVPGFHPDSLTESVALPSLFEHDPSFWPLIPELFGESNEPEESEELEESEESEEPEEPGKEEPEAEAVEASENQAADQSTFLQHSEADA